MLARALLLLMALASPAIAQSWPCVTTPAPGPARAIGPATLGCIAGAIALPPEGNGWQAVRISRNRHWGHPELIRFVQDLAGRSRGMGNPDLWIGDLAQPRGGRMPNMHVSHQTGLDVDIWLDLSPRPPMSRAAREEINVPSLVLADQSSVNARFTPAHARLIRLAAEHPLTDRVLVNHGIKRGLCEMHRGESWLRKIRPWRGHDSHMHIRIRCPAGSPECRDPPPIPAGDGCDSSLDWWLSEEARRPPPSTRLPGPPPAPPAACMGLLRLP